MRSRDDVGSNRSAAPLTNHQKSFVVFALKTIADDLTVLVRLKAELVDPAEVWIGIILYLVWAKAPDTDKQKAN